MAFILTQEEYKRLSNCHY